MFHFYISAEHGAETFHQFHKCFEGPEGNGIFWLVYKLCYMFLKDLTDRFLLVAKLFSSNVSRISLKYKSIVPFTRNTKFYLFGKVMQQQNCL